MRQYLRDNHPFGFQIIEGEITHPDLVLEGSPSEADISLALTRSTSYTLLPTSSGDWLSGLHEGAPSSSESSEEGGGSTDSTAETVPIARGTRPTRARSGASTTPSKAAKGAAGESNKKTPRTTTTFMGSVVMSTAKNTPKRPPSVGCGCRMALGCCGVFGG